MPALTMPVLVVERAETPLPMAGYRHDKPEIIYLLTLDRCGRTTSLDFV